MEYPNIEKYLEAKAALRDAEKHLKDELLTLVYSYMDWKKEDITKATVVTAFGSLVLNVTISWDKGARYMFSFYKKDENFYARLDFRDAFKCL